MVGEKKDEHDRTLTDAFKAKKDEVVKLLKESSNQRQLLAAIELAINGKKKTTTTSASYKTPASTRTAKLTTSVAAAASNSTAKSSAKKSKTTVKQGVKENVAPANAATNSNEVVNKTRPANYDSAKYTNMGIKPMTRRSVKPNQTILVETQVVKHANEAKALAGK